MLCSANSAEIAVMKELNKRGFFYQWLSYHKGHEYDLLISKNDKTARVEVKSTIFSDKKMVFTRDTAGSGKFYQEKIDFIIIVELYKSSYIKTKRFWVIPTQDQEPNNLRVKIPNDEAFINNFETLCQK